VLWPSFDDLRAAAVPFTLPLRRTFRGVDHREGLLIDGPSGWGEWAPFVEYSDDVAAQWLAGAVEAAYATWPAPVRTSIPVNAIIPGTSANDAFELTLAAVREQGCTTVKIKVGEPNRGLTTLPSDVARVAAVRAALDECAVDGHIRIDANAVWSVDEAEVALVALQEAAGSLQYAEQPCATLAELAQLRQRVDVPIAADESIRTAADPERAAAEGAVDLLVVKAVPLGGVVRALEVVAAAGVPCVVSGALDSAVGLGAGLALAGALPQLFGACGLGTGSLLAADVVSDRLLPRAGLLTVERITPDPAALRQATQAMSVQRRDWWFDRLSRAYAIGSQRGH